MNTHINQYIERFENVCFDVAELNKAVDELVKIRPFENKPPKNGLLYSNAICLNYDEKELDEWFGGNVRGKYWTKPDSSFEEMEREPYVDESRYTLFNEKLNDTYFKYVYDKINEFFEIGRCRVIKMPQRTTLSWHRDPEKRLHIAIKTNHGARMFIEHTGYHIPADGNIYVTDNTKYHTAINGGEEDRIHLVATVLGTK
tara:strand:- start:4291 stop:4890 length:600 start_codon:yes stop_codon:yes gene_type:complete